MIIKKLTKSMGDFTHADVLKVFENGTISCDMLILSEDGTETYREHFTTFDSGKAPFKLTTAEKAALSPPVITTDPTV